MNTHVHNQSLQKLSYTHPKPDAAPFASLAASSAATRPATHSWASPWRPHPQQAWRREDKPQAAVENLLSLWTPTPTSSLRPPNSPSLLPFQATRAHQQLRQELRHRLQPLAQALIPHKPQPSRSPPTPTGTAIVRLLHGHAVLKGYTPCA